MRRAAQCGGIDGVGAGGVLNRGQNPAGLLCKEVSFELLFTPYVRN